MPRLGATQRPGRRCRDRRGHDPVPYPGAHLASWAGRSPVDQQSAGRTTRRVKVKKGNRYLAGLLGETAVAAGRTETREGARYRRLARRRGKAKAQVALGNTQLRVYHALLSNPGTRYEDLGVDYYNRRNLNRQVRTHVQRLHSLGFNVALTPPPDPHRVPRGRLTTSSPPRLTTSNSSRTRLR